MTYTKILSFNGGGIRGLLSWQVLQRLISKTEDTPHPLLANPGDMRFAGTSVGSSIAARLATGGTVTKTYVDELAETLKLFYKVKGTDPTKPAYSAKVFRESLDKEYGSQTLGNLSRLVITAFQVTAGTRWKPVVFSTEGTPGVKLADAVQASCTMPGMFATTRITYPDTTVQDYVDGGFLAHDPTMLAIAAELGRGTPLSNIVVIDFGTGFMPQQLATDPSAWGAAQWQQTAGACPALLVNGTASPVLGISLNGSSTESTATMARALLGERFVNINPELPRFVAENDSTGVTVLREAADHADLKPALDLIATYWA